MNPVLPLLRYHARLGLSWPALAAPLGCAGAIALLTATTPAPERGHDLAVVLETGLPLLAALLAAPLRADHDQHARDLERSNPHAPVYLWNTEPRHGHPRLIAAPLPLLDDAALVERAVGTRDSAPDPAALGELYERYMPAIFAFALRNHHDRPLAEGITSETFLRALRALPRYTDRGLPIRSWFFRITVNLIKNLHRAAPALPVRRG